MKKIIVYMFLSIFLMGGLSSCFEDDGNYDYDDIFEVSVAGLEDSYLCYSLIDSLNLVPQITPKDEEYDCFWGVYLTNVQGYAPRMDTICHTRELHMLVDLAPNTYRLIFCAKEKNSGIPKFAEMNLEVVTPLSTGWYVLRGKNGTTDLDLFSPRGKVEDVIAKNNGGRALEGEAVCLGHSNRYKSKDPVNNRYVNTNTLFAFSSKGLASVRLSDGKIIHDFNTGFYSTPTERHPQAFFANHMGDIYFLNAGNVYTLYGMSPNSGRLGEGKIGDHKLSDFCVGHLRGTPILFDEKISSFCSADASGSNLIYFKDQKTEVSSNNMNIDLLYMGAGADKNWAIAKNKDSGDLQLLQLNPYAAVASRWKPSYIDLIVSSQSISNDKGLGQASKWAPNTTNNIIYFAKGNMIGSCNIDAELAEKEQYKLPVEEEVTYMRNLSFKNSTTNFNVLAVATSTGEKYKVYLFTIQAGNLIGEPQIMEGTGKVSALIYIDKSSATQLF